MLESNFVIIIIVIVIIIIDKHHDWSAVQRLLCP